MIIDISILLSGGKKILIGVLKQGITSQYRVSIMTNHYILQ